MSNSKTFKREPSIYPLTEVERFIKDCLLALETPENHAEELAKCLVFADYRGRLFNGVGCLDTYVNDIRDNVCDKNAVPELIKQSSATAFVDGKNALGVVVGKFCMNIAVQKAKEVGIGLVVVKGSNRYGLGSYYAKQAHEENMVGMSFSNAPPLVAPPYSCTRALGTNPLAFTAPAENNDSFLLDMTSSAVSSGRIEMLSRTNTVLPENWADVSTGALCPLGGQDVSQSIKGFGIGMMVEILGGILSGASYSLHLPSYGNKHEVNNLGQCFIAINPSFFEPGFQTRLQDFLNLMRNLESIGPQYHVMVSGDYEREHMEKVDNEGGVCYSKPILALCAKCARKLNVEPLQPLN